MYMVYMFTVLSVESLEKEGRVGQTVNYMINFTQKLKDQQ